MRFALTFAVVLAAVCGSSAKSLSESDYQEQFVSFMAEHNKAYESGEFFSRYNIFKAKLDEINAHNAGDSTYKMGINQFSASTAEEYASMLGYIAPAHTGSVATLEQTISSVGANPTAVNWVDAGRVTGVKDQGSCGSCWAFSSTGAIETANAIKHNATVISLSEQQLVDCSTQNSGCDGGLMDYAFAYVIKNGGLATESAYPYTYGKGPTNPKSTCKTTVNKTSTISKYTDVKANNQQALEDAIALGAVSVAIDAGSSAFSAYKSGVFSGACGTALNHGVLAVGYGTDAASGKKYWLVKNSWGTSWGEKGYIKMERTTAAAGLCGIQMQSSYVTVA